MNKEEILNLYDKVVSATFTNIYSFSKDKIVLKNYYDKNENHRFFLEVACMVGYIYNKDIYINVSLPTLLKIRFRKKNKHIHYISKKKIEKNSSFDIIQVGIFEAEAFNVENTIFGDIYREFYKKGK